MRGVFIALLLLYSIVEVYILRVFIMKKEKEALKSTSVSLLFLWLVTIATHIFNYHLPDFAFILMMLALFVHTFFGYFLNYYDRSKKFDRLAHGLGAFSNALFFYYLISNFLKYGGSKAFQTVYILLLGVFLGVVYEMIEFVTDLKNKKKMQRGLRDTNMDTVANMIGSVIAAGFAFFALL